MNIWEEIKMEAWEEGKEEGRMEGRMEGMETESFAIISSLIKHLPEANDETIANLTSKPVEWVAQVRREMNA